MVETVVRVNAVAGAAESAALTVPAGALGGRSLLARSRLVAARVALEECRLCVRNCGVDRTIGPAGFCAAGSEPRIFSAQVEVGDELEIIPDYAIALSGCNMRCTFCITGRESWNAFEGVSFPTDELAKDTICALESGAARTVQILGGEPTVHLPWLLEFVSMMPDDARLVLKTNGLVTAQARTLLEGLFDVWIVDLKFGGDDCARQLSRTPQYLPAVADTLRWAEGQSKLIVRHLVMPGHVDCCWGTAARWIADHIPFANVSLRFGYWPAWKAREVSALNRPINMQEQDRAVAIARELGLHLIR